MTVLHHLFRSTNKSYSMQERLILEIDMSAKFTTVVGHGGHTAITQNPTHKNFADMVYFKVQCLLCKTKVVCIRYLLAYMCKSLLNTILLLSSMKEEAKYMTYQEAFILLKGNKYAYVLKA